MKNHLQSNGESLWQPTGKAERELARRIAQLLAQGRVAEASAVLDALDEPLSSALGVKHLRVLVAIQGERWVEALPLLNDLIEVLPTQSLLHLDRAVCLIRLGQLSQARRALRDNYTSPGHWPTRYVMLAGIAQLEGDAVMVEVWLQKARLCATGPTNRLLTDPKFSPLFREMVGLSDTLTARPWAH